MEDLVKQYQETLMSELARELGIKNKLAVPRLVKIVVNCGLGEALVDKKVLEKMAEQLAIITGQKPQVARAKRAISTFKLRAGDPIGLKVTLRGRRMYNFLLKLTTLALPRVRDFRGISLTGFDGSGSYTLGVREQTIFPELDYNLVDKIRGFECTFVTTARDVTSTKALLVKLGLPFAKK